MRRLDRRIATVAEAHQLPYAAAVGLAAGVLTLPTPEPAETGRTASVRTDQLIAVGGAWPSGPPQP